MGRKGEVKLLCILDRELLKNIVGIYNDDKTIETVKENMENKHPELKFAIWTYALNIPNV